MTDVSWSTSLYYPYLSVDDGWLKLSLLYWDRIRRIVPKEAEQVVSTTQDSESVRAAAAAGLLLNASPDLYVGPAADRFRQKCFALLTDPQHAIHAEKILLTLPDPGETVTWVHHRKISGELVDELSQAGFARTEGEWVIALDQVAALYMSCLAAEMAESMGEPLVTDTPAFATGGEYLLFGQPPDVSQDSVQGSLLTKIGIDFPSVESMQSLPIDKLIGFREKRADERRAFRRSIDTIAYRISGIEDFTGREDVLNETRDEIAEAINDHRRTLDELGVKTVRNAFTLSVPSLLAPKLVTSWVGMEPASAAALAGMGIAINIVAWWADYRGKRREANKKNPWHYASAVQRLRKQNVRRGGSRALRQRRRLMGKK